MCIVGGYPKELKLKLFKIMTPFNSATYDQNVVNDIETDVEISLDQLARINGSGFFIS